MSDEATLEAELERRALASEDSAADLWARYKSVKDFLSSQYYGWVQANSPFLTDHGELHIKSVIQTASLLLGKHLEPGAEKNKRQLSSLDIFLILSGILWHDVGNVFGREGHAERAAEMTKEVKSLAFPDPDVHRLVTEIAMAHSGQNGLVKARNEEDCSIGYQTYTVFPRALAAIVRFADEVSENRSRISSALLPTVPEGNRVFWEYAHSISASRPEPERERVVVSISLQRANAVKKYLCGNFADRIDSENKIHLIDYILCRIEKMNNERAYCAPEFSRFATIREIVARFTLQDDITRVAETTVYFSDSGVKNNGNEYPDIKIVDDFFLAYPDWRPERLEESLEQ